MVVRVVLIWLLEIDRGDFIHKGVSFAPNNKSNEKGLLEIVSDYIKDLLPEHNDSVDAMAIIIYLQSEIRKRGYEIKSVEPFIMSEITR